MIRHVKTQSPIHEVEFGIYTRPLGDEEAPWRYFGEPVLADPSGDPRPTLADAWDTARRIQNEDPVEVWIEHWIDFRSLTSDMIAPNVAQSPRE